LGEQFAENKIGEFGYKNFSLTPDQAQQQIDEIVGDQKHPYNNDRANPAERERAIDLVNSLYASIAKAKQGQA
jgi:non-homologous end joining protein Ku